MVQKRGLVGWAVLLAVSCGSPDEDSPVDSVGAAGNEAGETSAGGNPAGAGAAAPGGASGGGQSSTGGLPPAGSGGDESAAGAAASAGAEESAGQGPAGGAGGQAGAPEAGAGGGDNSNAGNGFQIVFEYAYDTVGAFDAQKRVLLDASAMAWSTYIDSEFANIPAGTALRARHPEHIDMEGMVFTLDYEIDDFVLLVGTTAIDGIGGTLGSTSSSFTFSVMDMALLEELQIRYEGNPFQPWVAQTSFDEAENWFYDDTPETADDIPPEQNDFQTTAMHEIGHALGFGGSLAYEALVVDDTFTGPRAVEIFGGPVPLSSDLSHFARDTMIDGQTPVMELGSRPGERKFPTALDLAVLEDIGYAIRWDQVP